MERYPRATMPTTRKRPTAMLTRDRSITAPPRSLRSLGFTADELAYDAIVRRLDGRRRADLHDTPLVQHGHQFGELEDLGNLVTDYDRREAVPAVQVGDQLVDRVHEDGIEAGGGLVEEDDLRLGYQRARDGHALAHAAGYLGRIFRLHALEPDLAERRIHALDDLRAGQAQLLAQGEGHVLAARHGVEQRAALEDDAVAPPDIVERPPGEPRHVHVVDEDAAGVGSDEPDEVTEEQRLAAAATPDDDGDGAGGDLQIKAAQHRVVAERLPEAFDLDHEGAALTAAPCRGSSPRRG